MTVLKCLARHASVFLFGRRTVDIFHGYWYPDAARLVTGEAVAAV